MTHRSSPAICTALLCFGLTCGGAHADPSQGFYAGAAVSHWNYDESPDISGDIQTLEFNGGFWFNPLLSGEIRLGTSLGDQEFEVGNATFEVAMDAFGSVYWRPEVGNDVAKLYGLLGYSWVELGAETRVANTQVSGGFSDSGPSFGAGIGVHYTPNVVLNLEWKQLIDGDGFEIGGVTAGFDYRF